MKAVTWHGPGDVRVERVKDPEILNPRDAIVRVTASSICCSDLLLYNGRMPMMEPGDILGHEFVGIVEEVGSAIRGLLPGDRVVVPFTISCGNCEQCRRERWALCDNSNPNAELAERLYGFSCSGLFGHSHVFGGYSGGQAEFVRVPFADIGPVKIPDDLYDEQALFLTDVFPTGYMAAQNCDIKRGDVVVVWGCGPVGQFAIRSAFMFGANDVIAIDGVEERLRMAADGGARVVNSVGTDALETLLEMTGGRGPDACIDCVGLEAPDVLSMAIQAVSKGGTVSVPGVYTGFVDRMPMGMLFEKGVQLRTGITHVLRYVRPLLERIRSGEVNPYSS